MTRIVLIALPLLLMVACTDNALVRQSSELDPNGWLASEKAIFEFKIMDTIQPVDMFVTLRHNGDYPYRNLFLFTELTDPNGATYKDTIECLLADRLGHWLGGGNGFIFSNEIAHNIMFSHQNTFQDTGTYQLSLEQAMRDKELIGMLDVGITIQPSVK